MGHQEKVWDKNNVSCLFYFQFCAILRCIFTSGILQSTVLLEISIYSADRCILAMLCVRYALTAKNPCKPH